MRVLATEGTLSRSHSPGRHALHSSQAFFLIVTILDSPTVVALLQSRIVGRTAVGARGEAGAFKKGRVRALHSGPSACPLMNLQAERGPPEPCQPSGPRPSREESVQAPSSPRSEVFSERRLHRQAPPGTLQGGQDSLRSDRELG